MALPTPDYTKATDTQLAWSFLMSARDRSHAVILSLFEESPELEQIGRDLASEVMALGAQIQLRGHVTEGPHILDRTIEWARQWCTDHPDEVDEIERHYRMFVNSKNN